jgi:hypothetical protein
MFFLSTTRLARVLPTLRTISPPFGNQLIKHKPREEWDVLHEIKIRVLHKAYKQVFKQLYTSLCQDMQNKSESSQRDQYKITSK